MLRGLAVKARENGQRCGKFTEKKYTRLLNLWEGAELHNQICVYGDTAVSTCSHHLRGDEQVGTALRGGQRSQLLCCSQHSVRKALWSLKTQLRWARPFWSWESGPLVEARVVTLYKHARSIAACDSQVLEGTQVPLMVQPKREQSHRGCRCGYRRGTSLQTSEGRQQVLLCSPEEDSCPAWAGLGEPPARTRN